MVSSALGELLRSNDLGIAGCLLLDLKEYWLQIQDPSCQGKEATHASWDCHLDEQGGLQHHLASVSGLILGSNAY